MPLGHYAAYTVVLPAWWLCRFWGLPALLDNPALYVGGNLAVFGIPWVREGGQPFHSDGVHMEAPIRFSHLATYGVDPATPEGKVLRHCGEVDRVQPSTLQVHEASKTHALPLCGGGFFHRDEVAHHSHDVPTSRLEISDQHATSDDGFGLLGKQKEWGRQRKSEQFPFVKGI